MTKLRRGFSLVEMLIALTITSTLLAATMTALHASFRAYKFTTDAASTHVVSRIVMHRLLTMVRTGDQFGPYPADVLAANQNPLTSTYLEFISYYDANTLTKKVVRVERRDAKSGEQGPYTLYIIEKTYVNETLTATTDQPLLQGVTDVKFTLEYDIGPRLRRATVDLTVQPADTKDTSLHTELSAPTIRLVSSVMPRRLELEQ
ncbi:MAG: type II secretion system protein [Planctomycetes bacterium]|nr:type II secretion system protein [Planctomycetota bacterium]